MDNNNKYSNPASYAEKKIIKSIINGEYPIGKKLAPERILATSLGITRPTLREVLQRLASDGWITIKHGKPTTVNDFRTKSGFSVLKQLEHLNEDTTQKVIVDWLQFRILILPGLTAFAIKKSADKIIQFLSNAPSEDSEIEEFAHFDFELQLLIVEVNDNYIARMLYNDLSSIYLFQARIYFSDIICRTTSLQYYSELKECLLKDKQNYQQIVEKAMRKSLENWLSITSKINLKNIQNEN